MVPVVTSQPQSASVALGKTVSFSVAADGENLRYQLQYKKPGATSWIKWSGKTEASVRFKGTATNDGYQYRCVVSNDEGAVISSAATLTVKAPN